MALILILNADADAADAMARLLLGAGHQVRCCLRPLQALRLNRLLRFDFVWIALPLLGSRAGEPLELLRRLQHTRPLLRIAVINAEELAPEQRRQLKARGASVVLQRRPKPRLLLAITEIYVKPRVYASPTPRPPAPDAGCD